MKGIIEKFNSWIKRHTLFAVSAPIILLLLVYFVSNNISAMKGEQENSIRNGKYNNTLPNQKKELKVQQPNDIYKKSQQDSLAALNEKGLFKSMLDTKKENDSLERILEELNNFSLDEAHTNDKRTEKPNNTIKTDVPQYVSKTTAAQEKLEYRKLLMEARDERLSRSQDYSAPYSKETSKPSAIALKFDASIYRDQFILPGDRVTLILKEEVYFGGKHFPKNTFVYATSNIQGSRLLLEVTNINNERMSLAAIDQEDGMLGLHNNRAGELLQEFKADVQQQGVNELSEVTGEATDLPLARNLLRSFGNFFTKKKYKQRDKILLVNGDRVFLVQKK
ncbi:conjugative transposon protein TraM [Maribacter sp.]|nr:conjugative transposon protein TraM [Maribacter sp.]